MTKQAASLATPTRRIHWLDGLRSSLMLLGVVLHAAYPYSQGAGWLVRDPQRNQFFQYLTRGIHLFRMPAFFLVAGFFAAFLLRRSNPTGFIHERLRRIGVPLLSTLLTFNLAQALLLRKRAAPGAWLPSVDEVQAMWSSGSLLGHLWFLVYLLVFCAVLAACAPAIRRLSVSRWPGWLATGSGFQLMLGLAVAGSVMAVAVEHLAPTVLNHEYLGLVDPSELLTYAPFFGMGILLEMDETLLLRFSSPGPWTATVGIVALAATCSQAGSHDLLSRGLHLLASSLLAWMVIRLLFGGFRRIASDASPLLRYLSDASYSIYLMHHLIVVASASWLLSVPWGAWSKFAITLCLTISISLAAHHFLILRSPLLRLLFNGRRWRRSAGPDHGPKENGKALPSRSLT